MGFNKDAAESFLYREARLMDEHRYDEWLALWEEHDILYWVPCADDSEPGKEVSIVRDDRERLEDRIFRLQSRAIHAQIPRSRTCRVVGNVIVESDDGRIATVTSNFIFTELRSGKPDVFNGSATHRLRYQADSVRIASKKVLLVNRDEYIDNLAFLV